MNAENRPRDTFLGRKSWIVFIVVSAIFMLFGIGDVIQGMDADPAIAQSLTGVEWQQLKVSSPETANMIDHGVRSGGLFLILLSILSILVTLKAFRQGERWAWYALWIWPVGMAALFVLLLVVERQPGFPPPPPMVSAPVFFAFTLLALVATYSRFFPRKQLHSAIEKGAVVP